MFGFSIDLRTICLNRFQYAPFFLIEISHLNNSKIDFNRFQSIWENSCVPSNDYARNRPTIDSFNHLSVHYKIILKTRFWNRFEIDSVPIILNLLGNRFENDYALNRPTIDWGKQPCNASDSRLSILSHFKRCTN